MNVNAKRIIFKQTNGGASSKQTPVEHVPDLVSPSKYVSLHFLVFFIAIITHEP